jgi:hypothetical protein
MKVAPILLFLISLSAMATSSEILKCLGDEEKRFHLRKERGPLYDLNQRMIAEIIQIPGVTLDQESYREVCNSKKFSESWKLLELSIKKGKTIFILPSNLSEIQKNITEEMIADYSELTREILLTFISQIQALSPTPTCLSEEIPELNAFFTEIKYLQEDVDMKTIFSGKDQKIFDQLKNYPSAFEKCRARIKKKPKSESTAPAKKR